jgi:hypothetical protein
VPHKKKIEAVKQIGAILEDQNAPPRSKIAAARTLATMEGVTLQSIDVALRAYLQGELAGPMLGNGAAPTWTGVTAEMVTEGKRV